MALKAHSFSLSALNNVPLLDQATKWHPWSDGICDYLTLSDLEEFIKPHSPPNRPVGTAAATFREILDNYHKRHKYAITILRNRLGYTAKALTKDLDHSNTIYSALERHFKPAGSGFYGELVKQLMDIKLSSHNSVGEFGETIRKIRTQISEINPSLGISEALAVQCFLKGLGEEYQSFAIAFQAANNTLNTTLESVELAAINHEKSYNIKQPEIHALLATQSKNSHSTLTATENPNIKIESRRISWCTHCNKKYHKKDECHILHPEKATPKAHHKKRTRPEEPEPEPVANLAAWDLMAITDYQELSNQDLPTKLNSFNIKNVWVIDSGCSHHMTYSKTLFIPGTYRKFSQAPKIHGLGGKSCIPKGQGDIILQHDTGNGKIPLHLSNVLFCIELGANLISLTQLLRSGMDVKFDEFQAVISTKKGDIKAINTGNLYLLNPPTKTPYIAMVASAEKIQLKEWHERMGHLSFKNTLALQQMATGFNIKDTHNTDIVCERCLLSNAKDISHKSTFITPGIRELDLIHIDIKGPLPTGLNGERYFVAILEDYTKVSEVICIKSKDQITEVIKSYKLRNEHGHTTLHRIRFDNAKENSGTALTDWCESSGLVLEYSVPYSQQQNGGAEALIRVLLYKLRPMLHGANLESRYWPEAVRTANYLRNRSPCRAIKMTPYEKSTGIKPDLSHIRKFGQKCIWRYGSQKQFGSLQARGAKGRLLGYEGTRIYRILHDGTVKRATAVKFPTDDEEIQEIRDIDFLDESNMPTIDIPESHKDSSQSSGDELVHLSTSTNANHKTTMQLRPRGDYVPWDFKRNTTYQKPSFEMLAIWGLSAEVIEPYEPLTYKEALDTIDSIKWEQAMKEEYDSLMDNQTWDLAELPPNRQALHGKWVYKFKRGPQGEIIRYKARWVVKGFLQQAGIDYNETFASVVKPMSYKALFAIAAAEDLEIEQMDVKTAFLYGKIEEEIYIEQPLGFTNNTPKVCKLNKALYGLKQSPRVWYNTLSEYLKGLQFEPLNSDLSVFIKGRTIIAIYVDDLLFIGPDISEIREYKNKLQTKFCMTDLGPLGFYLGMAITRDRPNRILRISQKSYFEALLKSLDLWDIKTVDTPMSDKDIGDIPKEHEALASFKTKYQSAIGSIMYGMLGTRPDIAYAVSVVSRYSSNPTETHWKAVQRILRYIKGTLNYQLVFEGPLRKLVGYSDSDWAGDKSTRRSTSGFIFNIGSGAISWSSKRQPTVALSTCEAEYIGQTQATKEAIFLRNLLNEIHPEQPEATIIYCDNQGAITLARNPAFHARTKHISIQHHFVREKVTSGEIDLKFINTEDQIADGLTKPLAKDKFQKFRDLLGVRKVDE